MGREYENYWLPKGQYLLDKYRIEDVIEEGGMGIVYLGYDTILQLYVSIKEFFPRRLAMRNQGELSLTTYKGRSAELFRQGLDKFVKEARTLARFESLDCIVMVKEFFFANDTAYMVMERVEGENVKQYVERNGRMEPQMVLDIMRPILHSVNELHQEGLLHRDISPDNIILTSKGKGVLIDFGAARFSDMQEDKTMTVFFKRGYSAEEQYVEKSEKGAYTDVYSACATMYFMLTGIRPEESIRRILHDTVIPLTRFPDVNLSIQKKRCIMKGMSIRSKNRYSSIEQLCQTLFAEKEVYANVWKWVAGVTVLAIVFAGWGIGGQKTKEPEKKTKVVSQQNVVSPATVNVANNVTQAAVEEKKPAIKMISVVGKKKTVAVKKLKKLAVKKVSVKTIWKYSTKQKKGYVLSQSIKKGKVLKEEKEYSIVLTVSKGKKPKPVATPKATPKPVRKDEFEGELPW